MEMRSYQRSDYASIKKLLTTCGLFDKSYDQPDKFSDKTPAGSIIVAIEKSDIVGCVIFTWDGWDSSIYRLAVHPDHRKKGIGTRLLEEAEKRLRNLGADVSSLRMGVDNKDAQEFFRKRGYGDFHGTYYDTEKKL